MHGFHQNFRHLGNLKAFRDLRFPLERKEEKRMREARAASAAEARALRVAEREEEQRPKVQCAAELVHGQIVEKS